MNCFGENKKTGMDAWWLGLNADRPEDANVCVLGIPFDGGTSFEKGAAKAPDLIRWLTGKYLSEANETWDAITSNPNLIFDFGDVPIFESWDTTFKVAERIAYEAMAFDKFTLILGGDHSVTIPMHKAFKRFQNYKNPGAKIGIIHFDAHFDLCDNFDGNPWSHANTEKRALDDIVSARDLLFLGVRVAEDEELQFLNRNEGICVISARDIFLDGYMSAIAKIKDHFKGYDALYFTLDIDVLDPAYAPGTGTPVMGGITSRELLELVRLILKELPVKAMDIVEVSPPLDVNNITSWAAVGIIHEVLTQLK